MWQVSNHTPFSSVGYFLRARTGAEHWVVAVVGNFDVRPDGLLAVAETQSAPLLAPIFKDKNSRELLLEADLAPFRPQPDIIVSGTACLPDQAPAQQFDGTIIVGHLKKTARFFGERTVRRANRRVVMEEPGEVIGVHLTWRNALGGPDLGHDAAPPHPANPIGIGWLARWPEVPQGLDINLSHIENPDDLVRLNHALPQPHGFGGVQPAWLPRAAHAGTYDLQWQRTRAPLPPDDFSEQFHQSAPSDQVYPTALDGGAPVRVSGFHADGPYGFNLPQLVLTSRTRIGADAIDARLRLVAMALNASDKTVRLTWNTSVPCNGRDHLVTGSRVMLKQLAGVAA